MQTMKPGQCKIDHQHSWSPKAANAFRDISCAFRHILDYMFVQLLLSCIVFKVPSCGKFSHPTGNMKGQVRARAQFHEAIVFQLTDFTRPYCQLANNDALVLIISLCVVEPDGHCRSRAFTLLYSAPQSQSCQTAERFIRHAE